MNHVTLDVVLTIVVLVTIADIVLILKYGYEGTISHLLYRQAQAYPIISFAFGVIAGHLFWVNH